MDVKTLLKTYFGFDSFRPLQLEIINHVMSGNDALVLMPTGGGKSICYQIPALALPGTAVVISPLISLMKDQVETLRANGIEAAALNSGNNADDDTIIRRKCLAGDLKLLYISPEKLLMEIPYLLNRIKVSLFAIDEAHCISQWGHDFRPEYTQLGLLREQFPDVPIMALTATADKLTRQDILAQLKLKEPREFISSFDRPNLSLTVKRGYKNNEKMHFILNFIKARPLDAGIIYCLSRKTTEKVATDLRAKGIKALPYHAALSPLERSKTQEMFKNDEVTVICATVAFGMGIDKSNVRWVIHYNMPKSIESFYQEIGRAGRDGAAADTVLFYSLADIVQLTEFAKQSGQQDINMDKLKRMREYAESSVCRRRILLNYFGEPADHDCGNCDVCQNPPRRFDGTRYVQMALSAMMRTDQQVRLSTVTEILRGINSPTVIRKGYNQLKTFGVGREVSVNDWQDYLLQMLQMGFFEIAYDEGHHAKVTPSGMDVLYGRKSTELCVIDRSLKEAPKSRKRLSLVIPSITIPGMSPASGTEDPRLFEALRELRRQCADEEGFPPYIIFSDKVLHTLATAKPTSVEQFAYIPGVGEHKRKKYGTRFVSLIQRFAIVLMTCLGLWTAQPVDAQMLQATRSHYTTDNGLSSNAIAHIKQDDYGFLWIATWNGISRFDGFNFYNYKTGNGSHIPHLHNRTHDLVIDQQQNVWLRMYDGRVFVINRRTDRIEDPLRNVRDHEQLKTPMALVVTSSGDVLAVFPGTGIYKMRLDNSVPQNQLITTGDLQVTSIAEGYHNDIWVGTNQGVHRLDLNNLTVERRSIFGDESVTKLYSNGYNIYVGTESGKILTFSYGQEPSLIKEIGQPITSLYVDSYGVIWFSDPGSGILRYFPSTDNVKRFLQEVPAPEYDGPGAEFAEKMGLLWARLNHGGYGYYNRETDELEYFHNSPSNPWNLSNTINARLELEEGVVWESTIRRGLEKLEILKNNIERKMLVPNATKSTENEIRAMLYDKRRKLLLLGNKNNCLFIIRPDGSRTAITHDDKGQSIGRPYGLLADSKGNYWLCSKDFGVFCITPRANGGYSVRNFRHNDNDPWSLSANSAYAATEDRYGNIWVATFGGGVNLLVPTKNGGYRAYHNQNVMRHYPYNSYLRVRTMATDGEGNVWAGSTDGILIMSFKNNKLSIRKLENSQEEPDRILMSTDIVHLACDQHGTMWVGTNGGGISRAIGKDSNGTWLFESFTIDDGIPSEEIKSITFDDKENVWFATDRELCSFDKRKRIFSSFGNLDGVDGTVCSEGAALPLPNGNILFGTLNGYYVVDRKKLVNSNGSTLKLRITDFYLDDKLQSPRLNDTYDYYIPEARKVELPGHNSSFSVRFASMNYQMQHRVHYQYTLEGFDNAWKNADRSRTISYSQLPTGTYRLRIKAFLLESPENFDERVLEIVVPPYFLLSKNAIWLYLVLAVILSLAVMFLRQRQLTFTANRKRLQASPDHYHYQSEDDHLFIEHLLGWLEQHYQETKLKTVELIALSNLSRSQFCKRLSDITNMTPDEFVNDFRLRKAIKLLAQSQLTADEIAAQTGFASADDMEDNFKQRIGITTEMYRKEQASKRPSNLPVVASEETGADGADEESTDEYEIIDEE